MTKRRIFSLLACALIAVTALCGCGGKKEEPKSGGNSAADYDTPGGKKYDEVVELHTIRAVDSSTVKFENGDTIEDNIWTRTALEEYNIKIVYDWTCPNEQYAEKFLMTLASGNLPDYFFGTADNFAFLKQEGVLADLTDVEEKFLSKVNKEYLKLDGGAAQELATVDGRRYALVQPAGHESNAYILWLRQDWLDKLGLDIPETVDDFTAMLKAFYEEDPAESGKDDYVPLGVSNDAWTGSIKGLMNMFGAYKSIWLKKDGGYAYSSIQPEMKNALQQIANYYKLGYISKTYYNAQDSRIVELMGYNRMGAAFANYVSGVLIKKAYGKTGGDWVTAPIPSQSGDPAPSQIESAADTYWYVTSSCKHPDAVMKLFNLYTDKISNDYDTYGVSESGIDLYEYFYPKLGNPNENMSLYLQMQEAADTGSEEMLNSIGKERYAQVKNFLSGSTDKDDWSMNAVYGKNGALATVYKYYYKPQNYVKNAWAKADTAGMTENWSTLLTYENEVFQQIITGEKPIDYFDTFVAEWKRMGGDRITGEVNAALK